jgi:hypothetical protein
MEVNLKLLVSMSARIGAVDFAIAEKIGVLVFCDCGKRHVYC